MASPQLLAPVEEEADGEVASPAPRAEYRPSRRGEAERPSSARLRGEEGEEGDGDYNDSAREHSYEYSPTGSGSPRGGRRPGSAPLHTARGSLWESPSYTHLLHPNPPRVTQTASSPYGSFETGKAGGGGGGGRGGGRSRRVGEAPGIAAIQATRHRVDTSVSALLGREKEALAEEVVALRRRHTAMERSLRVAQTEAARTATELRRQDAQVLALSKEKQARNLTLMSGGGGGGDGAARGGAGRSSATSTPRDQTLVRRLKERVAELKVTVTELTAELSAANTSARASRVTELEAESQVYLSEVLRLTQILREPEEGSDDVAGVPTPAPPSPRSKQSGTTYHARPGPRRPSSAGGGSGGGKDRYQPASEAEALVIGYRAANQGLTREIAELKAHLAFGPPAGGGGGGKGGGDGEALAAAEEKAAALEARAEELFVQAAALRKDREHFRGLAAAETEAAVAAREDAALARGETARMRAALAREQEAALGVQLAAGGQLAPPPPVTSPVTTPVTSPVRTPVSSPTHRRPRSDDAATAATAVTAVDLEAEPEAEEAPAEEPGAAEADEEVAESEEEAEVAKVVAAVEVEEAETEGDTQAEAGEELVVADEEVEEVVEAEEEVVAEAGEEEDVEEQEEEVVARVVVAEAETERDTQAEAGEEEDTSDELDDLPPDIDE